MDSAKISDILRANRNRPLFGYGLGNSCSDLRMNTDAAVIDMLTLNQLTFDRQSEHRTCDVGMMLANNTHGKSSQSAGALGRHIRSVELLHTDGAVHAWSPERDVRLLGATVCGPDLTGSISNFVVHYGVHGFAS